jgi:hypothetical protein
LLFKAPELGTRVNYFFQFVVFPDFHFANFP